MKTACSETHATRLLCALNGYLGILDFCLLVGRGKGWSIAGIWLAGGIMFLGSNPSAPTDEGHSDAWTGQSDEAEVSAETDNETLFPITETDTALALMVSEKN